MKTLTPTLSRKRERGPNAVFRPVSLAGESWGGGRPEDTRAC
jgi:hypothetical protein